MLSWEEVAEVSLFFLLQKDADGQTKQHFFLKEAVNRGLTVLLPGHEQIFFSYCCCSAGVQCKSKQTKMCVSGRGRRSICILYLRRSRRVKIGDPTIN